MFVNTASASGPFIEALAAPGRTIVTATRNGAERFATLFGGYFVDALAGDAADADKNGRVVGARGVQLRQARGRRAPTSGKGSCSPSTRCSTTAATKRARQTPTADGKNGRVASMLSLGHGRAAEALPADPKLRALYDERRELERRVEGAEAAEGQHGAGRRMPPSSRSC